MKNLLITMFAVSCFFSLSANAGKILLTQFDHTGYADMKANLEADGHTVDIVNAKIGGSLAIALTATEYDQVFLWDLTSSLYLNNDDLVAIDGFWSTDMGVVVDTRSYGYHFQGNNSSEVSLLQNIANNLGLSGGGIWFGTDDSPIWSKNANAVLDFLGFNPVTGNYSDPVNYADPTSILLDDVTAGDLWGGGASVAKAPIGLQSNGVEMFAHFGNINALGEVLPYISASFDLRGPQPVPVPATVFCMAIGLLALSFRRKV
ncbi:MAG: PEP-CTERM sorting domain-containing protein [Colwellia sp.]|nr:PEP-CTERM sorting domain-containing protein [Colwellia sp.]